MQVHQFRPLHRGSHLLGVPASGSFHSRPCASETMKADVVAISTVERDMKPWTCPSCDFVNSADTPICIVDLVVRPGDESKGLTQSPLLMNNATTSTPKVRIVDAQVMQCTTQGIYFAILRNIKRR